MKKIWKFLGFSLLVMLVMVLFWPAVKSFTVNATQKAGLSSVAQYESKA